MTKVCIAALVKLLGRMMRVLCVLQLAPGCSPLPHYVGEQRPANEVATISSCGERSCICPVEITDITPQQKDDRFRNELELGYDLSVHAVLPGSYVITTQMEGYMAVERAIELGLNTEQTEECTGAACAAVVPVIVGLYLAAVLAHKSPPSKCSRNVESRYPVCQGLKTELDALAGHTYRVDGALDTTNCWLWVEDTDTGEVVSGVKPEAVDTSQ